MTRPSVDVLLLGNELIVVAIWFLFIGMIALWLGADGSIFSVFLGAGFAARSIQAHLALRTYRRWRRDWAAMNGMTTPRPIGSIVRRVLAIAVCVGLFAACARYGEQPSMGWVLALFWVTSLTLFFTGLVRSVRRDGAAIEPAITSVIPVAELQP